MTTMPPDHTLARTIDGASILAVLGALAGWLPPVAALLGILWYCIQIYESKTVQNWIHRKDVNKK